MNFRKLSQAQYSVNVLEYVSANVLTITLEEPELHFVKSGVLHKWFLNDFNAFYAPTFPLAAFALVKLFLTFLLPDLESVKAIRIS